MRRESYKRTWTPADFSNNKKTEIKDSRASQEQGQKSVMGAYNQKETWGGPGAMGRFSVKRVECREAEKQKRKKKVAGRLMGEEPNPNYGS